METYIALLQNHQSRDKILRTVSYACGFATGGIKGKLARDLGIIAQRVSAARTVNRLFDDIPMWSVTKTWGASDRDPISRALTSLANIAIQIYFPFEKLAWASDNEILSFQSKPLWNAGIACWGIFLFLNILRSFRQLAILKARLAKVLKQRKLESPERSGEQDMEYRKKIAEIKTLTGKEYLLLIKNVADFVMVINWLPLGILWSEKLSPSRTAFFGLISSLIGLFLNVAQYKADKSKSK